MITYLYLVVYDKASELQLKGPQEVAGKALDASDPLMPWFPHYPFHMASVKYCVTCPCAPGGIKIRGAGNFLISSCKLGLI